MPRRCAFGCPFNSGSTYHRFPNLRTNPEQFKLWVDAVGGKLESESDYEIFMKKVICDNHFTESDRNRNKRLNCLAVPSLSLLGNISTISTTPEPHLNLEPSTSTQAVRDISETLSPVKVLSMLETLCQPSTSDLMVSNKNTAEIITAEHNYFKNQSKQNKRSNPKRSVPCILVSKLKTTEFELRNLKLEMCRLRKRSQSYKAKLDSVEKTYKEKSFKLICNNMTPAAKILTKMQYTQTSKKPKGRRFAIEEKVLALTMYKKSPKGYTLLSNFFTLPSAKSLKRLLSQVKLEPGLNKSVFFKIKKTVKELAPEDRICSLIFDEMSITPQLQYDAASDKLKGFAYVSKTFADHALVFMVKGAKKNYKQPIAYYFTNCLNKYQLKNIIKEVVAYVNGTGLTIICTICDQSTVNVSAINELVQETKEIYLREGKQWREDIILIRKSKIIPLFDVPHLLKGIRNNLLTKDMKYFDFNEKVEKVIKWEYFKKVYEADKSYGELKLLHKITDEHIYVKK